MANQGNTTDPVLAVAMAIWGQRRGSELVPWSQLGEPGRQILMADAKEVIKVYEHAKWSMLHAK
jgi:hypothetical protein